MNADYNFFVSALTPLSEINHQSTEQERTRAAEAIALIGGSFEHFNVDERSSIFDLLDKTITQEKSQQASSSRIKAIQNRVVEFITRTFTVVDDFSGCSSDSLVSRASELQDSLINLYENHPEILDFDLVRLAGKSKVYDTLANGILEKSFRRALDRKDIPTALKLLPHIVSFGPLEENFSKAALFRPLIERIRQSTDPQIIDAIIKLWNFYFTNTSYLLRTRLSPFGLWDPINELTKNLGWQQALRQNPSELLEHVTLFPSGSSALDIERVNGDSNLLEICLTAPRLPFKVVLELLRAYKNEKAQTRRIVETVFPTLNERDLHWILSHFNIANLLVTIHDPDVIKKLLASTIKQKVFPEPFVDKILKDPEWAVPVAEDRKLLWKLIRFLRNSSNEASSLFPKIIENGTGLWKAMSPKLIAEILEKNRFEWLFLAKRKYIDHTREVFNKLHETPELRDAVFLRIFPDSHLSLYHEAMEQGNLELVSLLQETYPHLHEEKMMTEDKKGNTPVRHALLKEQFNAVITIIPELAHCSHENLRKFIRGNLDLEVLEKISEGFIEAIVRNPEKLGEVLTRSYYLDKYIIKAIIQHKNIAPLIGTLLNNEPALQDFVIRYPLLLDIFVGNPILKEAADPTSVLFRVLGKTRNIPVKIQKEFLSSMEPKSGNYLLHLAALSNHTSVLQSFPRELIEYWLFTKNENDERPLELAARANNWKFLLEALSILSTGEKTAANIQKLANTKDKQGNTLFELIAQMREIPPELAAQVDQIKSLWGEIHNQQIKKLHQLEELFGEELTIFSEPNNLSNLSEQIGQLFRKISNKRQEVWNKRADRNPIFLLPNEKELKQATLTRFSFEGGMANAPIPLADPAIDIKKLLAYLNQIEENLPESMKDEGATLSREDILTRLRTQITHLAQNEDTKDEMGNSLSETFKGQITNILRHLVKSLETQEAAIATAPEEERDALQADFNFALREILWERLGPDFFHCHDRLATDCEDLYYERTLGLQKRAESKQLSNRILNKLFKYRRDLFHEAVSHVPQDKHVAATHRYYRTVLGREFGIGSTELSQENNQYAGHRVGNQEERIRKEMRAGLTPEKVVEYIIKVIDDPKDKDITSALVTEWIQEHYPEAIDDFIPEGGKWNPKAIAILLQDLNILKRIGMPPPLSFTKENSAPLPQVVEGGPPSLRHRLQAFNRYVELAEESHNLQELSVVIIDLLDHGLELLSSSANEKEARVLEMNHQQLLDNLGEKWNHSFELLKKPLEGFGGKRETMRADRALFESVYNQLTFLDAPQFQDENLVNAHQFKHLFEGMRAEKENFKKAIDDLNQEIDALSAAEEKEREEREIVRKEKERLQAAEAEEKAVAQEANMQAEQALVALTKEKEDCGGDKAKLKTLLDKLSTNDVRNIFRRARQEPALRALMNQVRAELNRP